MSLTHSQMKMNVIIRTLLSNTTINIQFEGCKEEEIETNIESP